VSPRVRNGSALFGPNRILVGQCAIEIAFQPPDFATGGVDRHAVRIAAQRLVRIRKRPIQLALVAPGESAVAVGRGQARIETDDLVVIGNGAIELALVVVGGGAAVVRKAEARIEADRLVVVGDGLVELALAFPGVAAAVVRALVGGIGAQRLVELDDGAIEVVLQQQAHTAMMVTQRLQLFREVSGVQDSRAGGHLETRIGHLLAIAPVLLGQRSRRHDGQRHHQDGCKTAGNAHRRSPRREGRAD